MIKAILLCFLYAVLNVSGAAIIKLQLKGGVLNELKQWLRFLISFQVILAFILIFASALALFKALSSESFSFILPISVGINFTLTIIAGYVIFKDQLNYLSFIGFGLIISGIIVLSLNNFQNA